METLIVKVDNKKNLTFLRKLLLKLNFVEEVQFVSSANDEQRETGENKIPVQWAKSKPSFQDFSGIWKNRNLTLEQLREKAWKRN